MIKLAAFDITSEVEEFNKFVEAHPPRSTEKQSGIVFHDGYAVVIYDDGKENPEEKRSLIRSLMEGERHKLFLVEHSLGEAQAAIKKLRPNGYKKGMTATELRKLLEKNTGVEDYIPAEQLNSVHAQLEQLENQVLMDTHEMKRLNYSLDSYQNMLENI